MSDPWRIFGTENKSSLNIICRVLQHQTVELESFSSPRASKAVRYFISFESSGPHDCYCVIVEALAEFANKGINPISDIDVRLS